MKHAHVAIALLAATLAACDSSPTGDPNRLVRTERFGESVDRSVAIGAGNKKHWLRALVTGYTEPSARHAPARI